MPDLKVDCPRCGVKSVTADIATCVPTGTDAGRNVNRWEAAGTCRRCKLCTVYKLTRRDDDYARRQVHQFGGDLKQFTGHWDQLVEYSGYVTSVDEAIPDVPEHLPIDVHTAYKEALICLSAKCPNAAGAMLRLSLDLATKQLLDEVKAGGDPQGISQAVQGRLADRIKWLIDSGHVPRRLKPFADEVRLSGNDGAHDGTLTMDDALDLRDFSEAYMQEMFTAKGRLAEAEARRKARRGGA